VDLYDSQAEEEITQGLYQTLPDDQSTWDASFPRPDLACRLPPFFNRGCNRPASKRQKVCFENATDVVDVKVGERIIQTPNAQRSVRVLIEGLELTKFLLNRRRCKVGWQKRYPNGRPVPGTYGWENGAANLGKHHTPQNRQRKARGLWKRHLVEKSKVQRRTLPPNLEIPQRTRDSHFPPAPTTTSHLLKAEDKSKALLQP
jgi:hypothetical protein